MLREDIHRPAAGRLLGGGCVVLASADPMIRQLAYGPHINIERHVETQRPADAGRQLRLDDDLHPASRDI